GRRLRSEGAPSALFGAAAKRAGRANQEGPARWPKKAARHGVFSPPLRCLNRSERARRLPTFRRRLLPKTTGRFERLRFRQAVARETCIGLSPSFGRFGSSTGVASPRQVLPARSRGFSRSLYSLSGCSLA